MNKVLIFIFIVVALAVSLFLFVSEPYPKDSLLECTSQKQCDEFHSTGVFICEDGLCTPEKIIDSCYLSTKGKCLVKDFSFCEIVTGSFFNYEDCLEDLDNSRARENCVKFGGRWNGCGNKCEVIGQGIEGIKCSVACEQFCECGGAENFTCSPSQSCIQSIYVQNPIGFCQ